MRKRLRIAVAGGTSRWWRGEQCELAGIVDPAPGAADAAEELGVALYASLAELMAHGRLDGIIFATPNSLHVEHGLASVAVGVAALIEKPLADSVDAGQRLCEAAERAGGQAAHRPSSSAQRDHDQGNGHRAQRPAWPAGRHCRDGVVLQTRFLFRQCAQAAATGAAGRF